MSDIREIAENHIGACTEAFNTGKSGFDWQPMIEEIEDWHKAELERVIGEDEEFYTANRYQKLGYRNELRAEQRKRAGL